VLLECDVSVAVGYRSQPQISRVVSEKWFQDNAYCLSCGNDRLSQTPANTRASDFVCQACDESYELKAFRSKPVKNLVDGAYGALIARIKSESVPTLMLLERNEKWQIQSLTAIHHLFLTSDVVEERRPLSTAARRAGWVGCNIRLDLIAPDAQIRVVHEGNPIAKESVRQEFQRFDRLKSISLGSRGWANLTLRVLRGLDRSEFSITEIYERESLFSKSYPRNRNIRAKIRQQLQVLRDLGYLQFLGDGKYSFVI
jgi:type II restriction enzyme